MMRGIAVAVGIVGVTLTAGATGFAWANALQDNAGRQHVAVEISVNRTNKSDRSPQANRIISDRSAIVVADGAQQSRVNIQRPAQRLPVQEATRRPIACEPVVSVLAEGARRMPAGRCVT